MKCEVVDNEVVETIPKCLDLLLESSANKKRNASNTNENLINVQDTSRVRLSSRISNRNLNSNQNINLENSRVEFSQPKLIKQTQPTTSQPSHIQQTQPSLQLTHDGIIYNLIFILKKRIN